MKKSMIVIGSGLAGLSAGCYARMNGYYTTLLEQHSSPGGLCTSWRRGEYIFDGCIHWLAGSSGEGLLGQWWNEVGALAGKKFVYPEVFTQIETGTYEDKKTFTVFSDADKLNEHMKTLGPDDSESIDAFTDLIKKFTSFPMAFDKPFELLGIRDYLAMLQSMRPYFKELKTLRTMTVRQYANGYKSVHLREGIEGILGGMPDFSFLALVLMLAWAHNRSAGFPIGGSLEFSRSIEEKYRQLGGIVRYGSRVEHVIVTKRQAVGVRLEDGTEQYADIIVSAADGYATIFKLLSGKYVDRAIRTRFDTLPIFEPFFCLSLGVRRDFSQEPPLSVRILERPMEIEGRTQTKIGIKHYCFDPTLAPAGKSVLQVLYTSDYDYWLRFKTDRSAYEAEKAKIADLLVGAIEGFYPGIAKDIEAIDTATPLTFERYTGNWRGSFEGWMLTPKTMSMRIPKIVPGVKNFYMVGQWVQPGGGLPNSLKSGRDLVNILCKKEGQTFRTS